MTNFFERQEHARRRTGVFLIYFAAAVALTVLLVYLIVVLVFAFGDKRGPQTLWHPDIFLWAAGGTLCLIGGGSLFRILELSSGGGGVARALGGRLINPQTRDPLERRLINVVEEMSLASGVPSPLLYVLDEEEGINAFAAGLSPKDAAIGVTRGCLKWLNRDELQGVIAHEFSHIFNGDMRMNIRLMGFIAGILSLTTIGYLLMRVRGRDKGAGQMVLLGVGLLLIGWIGAFFARLIQAAISRQREYLADASAVQFTRLPDGLASALKKIGGLAQGSKLQAARACEAGHLFFSNGLSAAWSELAATHPPLVERIKAIDPSFNGVFPRPQMPPQGDVPKPARKASPPPIPGRIPGLPPVIPIPTMQALHDAGQPAVAHLAYAAEVNQSWPAAIENARQEPFGATALVCALLFSSDAQLRSQQLRELAQTASAALASEAARLVAVVDQLPVQTRLPLVDLVIPTLRGMSAEQYAGFAKIVSRLIASDQRLDLFEYALQKVLKRHLEAHFHGSSRTAIQYYSIKAIAPEISLLLSALAHVGNPNAGQAQTAFAAGARVVASPQAVFNLAPWEACNPEALDAALDKCATALPAIRQRMLEAMAQTVAADGVIQPSEAELIRAFADSLDCPLPPFVSK